VDQADDRPIISVVVPTYGRGGRLGSLIASLEDQDLGRPYEVIVVDDGSPAASRAQLQALSTRASIPLRTIMLDVNGGPARARNHGWRSARADLVGFTDDDCTPQRGWLSALVSALGKYEFVQGRTQPDPAEGNRAGPFSRTMLVVRENGFYETCNMGYRRTLLEQMGGFDEGFRYPAGEDSDLGCRAREAGASFSYDPDALVYHDVVNRGYLEFLRNTRRWAGVVRVVRLHPEMRRYFSRGPFWLRSHDLATLAACGLFLAVLAVARGFPLALAACCLALGVPYAYYRLRVRVVPGSKITRLVSLPAVWLCDLMEAAVHVASLVRFRSPHRAPPASRT
jgi:glycosyltransferase involved in cell wall biosynthesis